MKFPTFALIVCVALVSTLSLKAATIQVQVGTGTGGLQFSPAAVTIQVGDTVQWTWVSDTHSATSGTPGHSSGLFDSGVHDAGYVFSYTFTSPGSIPYYCQPHGACCGMVGTVTVNAASDIVDITRAQYTSTRSQLTVTATDSDSSAKLTASITSTGVVLGPLRGKSGTYSGKFTVSTNPVNITVTSDLGGSDTAVVKGR